MTAPTEDRRASRGRPRVLDIADDTPPARRRLVETLQMNLPLGRSFTSIAASVPTSVATVSRAFKGSHVPSWSILEGIVVDLYDHRDQIMDPPPRLTRQQWFTIWAAAWIENGAKPYDLPPVKKHLRQLPESPRITVAKAVAMAGAALFFLGLIGWGVSRAANYWFGLLSAAYIVTIVLKVTMLVRNSTVQELIADLTANLRRR
ncbi:hypothetical protein [Streptomyces sp. NPDC096032]|uniref:hypothetical protein n=1 Tax=Streptomyces sp. NPDC096032 TaxID=3366070 RepID=UPI00381814CF